MAIATDVIANAEDYQRVLASHPVVFLLFVSKHCPACKHSGPLFQQMAGLHTDAITSLVLDTAHTPRHEAVTGIPTLLVFQNGQMVDKLKGFGAWEEQEATLQAIFARYAGAGITPPASIGPGPIPESTPLSHP
ncbi:MAG: Thioredoxin [Pseudomonas sp.]|nr:MAG: Thioredoxin [Pseudomonas sp.]